MLKGKLLIDGIDAYERYGAAVVEEGWNDFIEYPPLKTVKSNDWHEDDGIEVDLSSPSLGRREGFVGFFFNGDGYADLIAALSDGVSHLFFASGIGRSWRLRLSGNTALETAGNDTFTCSLLFVEDEPFSGYSYAPPSGGQESQGYELDGSSLSVYGIKVLEGTLSEVMKTPAVKENLFFEAKGVNGGVYDSGGSVTFRSKDVSLKLLMRADNLPALWRCYDAFLYDLIKPGERSLYVEAAGQSYPCHYKESSVIEFYPDGRPWLRFDLTLVFTSFRLGENEYILAAEDGRLVALEEDGDTVAEVK